MQHPNTPEDSRLHRTLDWAAERWDPVRLVNRIWSEINLLFITGQYSPFGHIGI